LKVQVSMSKGYGLMFRVWVLGFLFNCLWFKVMVAGSRVSPCHRRNAPPGFRCPGEGRSGLLNLNRKLQQHLVSMFSLKQRISADIGQELRHQGECRQGSVMDRSQSGNGTNLATRRNLSKQIRHQKPGKATQRFP
jgi:hypothetical protein